MSLDIRNTVLRPLGGFASAPQAGPWTARDLDTSATMAPELRELVAAYLKRCPMILAWMEYTRDEIGDRFGVSGGSAICSDGTYYWRYDAVDYIREYGIAVPDEAVRHFESLDWQPPVFSREDLQILDTLLSELFVVGRGDDDAIVFKADGTVTGG